MKRIQKASYEDTLLLTGSIDEEMTAGVFQYICQQVQSGSTNRPHTFYLNSDGGCSSQGLQLYSLIKNAPFPIDVHVIGRCWSAAIGVLLAGRNRYCTPESEFLIHYGNDEQASVSELKWNIRCLRKWSKMIEVELGISKKKALAWHNSEVYFTPKQALACGLVHEVKFPWSS